MSTENCVQLNQAKLINTPPPPPTPLPPRLVYLLPPLRSNGVQPLDIHFTTTSGLNRAEDHVYYLVFKPLGHHKGRDVSSYAEMCHDFARNPVFITVSRTLNTVGHVGVKCLSHHTTCWPWCCCVYKLCHPL